MMDSLYAPWRIGAPFATRDRPELRLMESTDAFSFGEPAHGLHAFRQEWAPALDLFDNDRPDNAPPATLALAKLVGLVACLTVFAGVLVGAVGRLVVGAFSG
jgi:hypothetical protein